MLLGTHGRSFYSLDNIGVLRQISRETTNEPVVLFHPSDATRSISRGVAIDYYLKQPPTKSRSRSSTRRQRVIVTFTGTPPESGGREGVEQRRPRPAEPDEEGGGRGGPPATVDGQAGHEPVHLGHAIPGRARLSRADHVGRQRTRPAGAARKIPGEADRSRRHENAGFRDQAQCGRADCYRRRPARAVQAREGDQRQGHHRERGGGPNPEPEGADSGSDRQAQRSVAEGSGPDADRQADRRRRGDLSVPESQQPGSAQLSDPIEQQAGSAAGHRRERRQQTDRSVVHRVQGPVVAARPAASEARRTRPAPN